MAEAPRTAGIPEPQNINNWVIFADFLEAVLIDFKESIWDDDEEEYMIELTYKPTPLMKFVHQIELKGKDYDRTKDAFVTRYPMDMMGYLKPRTKGTYIFMLCDWKGEKASVFEKIDKNLHIENKKLRRELLTMSALLIREQTRSMQLAKHPEQVLDEVVRQARKLRKVTAPSVIAGQPVTPSSDEVDD